MDGIYRRHNTVVLQLPYKENNISLNGNGGEMNYPSYTVNIGFLLSYIISCRFRCFSKLVGNGELTVRGRKIVNILVDPDIKRKPGCLDAAAVSQTGSPSFAIVKVSSP